MTFFSHPLLIHAYLPTANKAQSFKWFFIPHNFKAWITEWIQYTTPVFFYANMAHPRVRPRKKLKESIFLKNGFANLLYIENNSHLWYMTVCHNFHLNQGMLLTLSNAWILSMAPPLPPEIMAPAWPILRPGGAVRPAMNDTTGLGFGPCKSSTILVVIQHNALMNFILVPLPSSTFYNPIQKLIHTTLKDILNYFSTKVLLTLLCSLR